MQPVIMNESIIARQFNIIVEKYAILTCCRLRNEDYFNIAFSYISKKERKNERKRKIVEIFLMDLRVSVSEV